MTSENSTPKDQVVGSQADVVEAMIESLREALEFYADPNNWLDSPSWDGDPECFTSNAIPGRRQEGTFVCDCGDVARAALSAAAEAK